MTDEQVNRMLADTHLCDTESVGLHADLSYHVRALADERERLLEGYRQMVQIISDRHKWHWKVAKAIILGADPREPDSIIAALSKWHEVKNDSR